MSPLKHLDLLIFIQVLTLILLGNFGWFREQFCLIVCPYGRLQAVLMDEETTNVLYDYNRGEPRKSKALKDHGDCVNCLRCVNVCPTGIDIRNGTQLECIACTACIDACDEIMKKVGYEKGLIRYTSETELQGKPRKFVTSRGYVFLTGLVILASAFVYALTNRAEVDVKILRAIASPYHVIQEDEKRIIVNHFKIHVTNQSSEELHLQDFQIPHLKGATIVAPEINKIIAAGKNAWVHVFVKCPEGLVQQKEQNKYQWQLTYRMARDSNPSQTKEGDLIFLSPEKKP